MKLYTNCCNVCFIGICKQLWLQLLTKTVSLQPYSFYFSFLSLMLDYKCSGLAHDPSELDFCSTDRTPWARRHWRSTTAWSQLNIDSDITVISIPTSSTDFPTILPWQFNHIRSFFHRKQGVHDSSYLSLTSYYCWLKSVGVCTNTCMPPQSETSSFHPPHFRPTLEIHFRSINKRFIIRIPAFVLKESPHGNVG